MAIVWPYPLGVDAYIEAGRKLEVPRPDCPACTIPMSFWSGYLRYVRFDGLIKRLFIPRVRCAPCQVSHCLLPAFLLLNRLDVIETIGEVIEQVTNTSDGVRPTAACRGVPHTTARGWVRRFRARSEELAGSFSALGIELGARPRLFPSDVLPDAVRAIKRAFATARDLVGWARLSLWRFVSAVCGGGLLAINTNSPYLIIGRRRFMAPVPDSG